MNKPPMDGRIKRPFKYVPSGATDVAKTIRRAQDALKEEAKAAEATNVRPMKRAKEAA